MNEKLLHERNYIWIAGNGTMAHINPNCKYVDETHHKKPTSVYPPGYLEICSACEERWDKWTKNWHDGLRKAGEKEQCQRCGAQSTGIIELCEDCKQTVKHRRAKKRLLQE